MGLKANKNTVLTSHAGRPRIEISVEEVEKLAQIGATIREMACFFGVDTNTIDRRLQEPQYRDAINHGDGNLNIGLRRKQVEMALRGDRTMLIWLGKQRLGQTDKVLNAITGADTTEGGTSASAELAGRIAGLAERLRQAGNLKIIN